MLLEGKSLHRYIKTAQNNRTAVTGGATAVTTATHKAHQLPTATFQHWSYNT